MDSEPQNAYNILMICYYYPPLVDVGCKRSVAFSKYFQKYGWKPFVLSVKNPDRMYCILGNDKPPKGVHTEYSYSIVNMYKFLGKFNGLCSRILKMIGLELTGLFFYSIFCIPDIFWGWIPLAVIKGFKIIKRYDIDIIYTSSPPFSSAIVGILLKGLSKKPLVLDFRDPLALNFPTNVILPKFRQLIDQKIESCFLKQADVFVVVAEELREAYLQRYPELRDRIFTLYNGFDAALLFQGTSQKYPKFTICYAGNFYFKVQVLEIFTHALFQGISILKKSGMLNRVNFQFLYYGENNTEMEKIASDYGIRGLVVARQRIPHQKMLSVVSKSHLQLLRIIKPAIGSKVFEGLALNVPLLATIPSGEVEEIIKDYSPSSYVISDGSPEKIADAITDAIEKYEKGQIEDNRVDAFLDKFSRENLTLKLLKTIEEKIKHSAWVE